MSLYIATVVPAVWTLWNLHALLGPGLAVLALPAVYLLMVVLPLLLAVLAAKWLGVGRYWAGTYPMWTPFVWCSEAVTALYEETVVPLLLQPLCGTPFAPWILRLFGCRIGRGVYLETTDITEFDMVEIGDHAELLEDCGPQTHLFEDRVMKIGAVRIAAGCHVGHGAILL